MVARLPLTRQRILEAAARIADAEGLDRLSMRRLGAELGVEAMSLYNHVAGKAAVLDGIVEVVLEELKVPADDGTPWQERTRETARSFRRLAHTHPRIFPLFATRPLNTPDALRQVEAVLGLLRGAGFDDETVPHVFRSLVGYVMGFALIEIGGLLGESESSSPLDMDALPPVEFPNITGLRPQFGRVDPDVEFEFGLDALLAGLSATL